MDAVEGMKTVIDLCKNENVTGEFVTTMLRQGGGSREEDLFCLKNLKNYPMKP